MSASASQSTPIVKRVLRHVGRLDYYMQPFLTSCLLFVLILQITARSIRGLSMPWTLEVITFLFGAMVWFGVSTAIKEGGHVGITFFVDLLPRKAQAWLEVLQLLLVGVFLAVIAYFAVTSLQFYYVRDARTPAMRLPYYIARFPVVPGIIFAYYRIIEKLVFLLRGILLPSVELETVKLSSRVLPPSADMDHVDRSSGEIGSEEHKGE